MDIAAANKQSAVAILNAVQSALTTDDLAQQKSIVISGAHTDSEAFKPGVGIGRGSVIGSASVVTRSVAAYTVVAGGPAPVLWSITTDDQVWQIDEPDTEQAMKQTLNPTPRLPEAHLAADLAQLGLRTGEMVMVQTSLKSLGWVIGSKQTVLEALRDAVGAAGNDRFPCGM